jgi:serine-type D-Ala-D-Ala carboxypeptidase/endopeptidase (penicillin-binding protein 4)
MTSGFVQGIHLCSLRLLLTLGCLAVAAAPGAANASASAGKEDADRLPAPVALAVKSLGLPESGVSLWVQPVDGGTPLVNVNADVPRNPASTLKLVTTFAALQGLGPAYTWTTDIYVTTPPQDGRISGDLLLRGSGDPYLVAEEYWKLADGLRKRGLRRIEGDLVFDNSYFDLEPEDPGAFDNRPDRVYNLPPHPLLVNFNAVRFDVRPQADGRSVAVQADPPLRNLALNNRLRLHSAPCGGYQRGVAVALADPDVRDQVLLEGQFPAGCDHYALTRTVLQPESYAFGLFDLYWHQLGGEIGGRWRIDKLPDVEAEPFYRHHSRPLGDIIRLVNKYSNNVMTRHLELTLGAERFGAPATAQKGRDAVYALLDAHGVSTEGLEVSNSAGLSRDSRISARQLAGVLEAAWRSPYMPEFISSLAIAGLDGTMRRRLTGSPAEGRMHLKTGRLDHVSAVAGYVTAHSGQRLAVVLLINAPDAHRGLGNDLQDVVLRWVLDH